MSPTLLQSFHAFVARQLLAEGVVDVSPEEAIRLWREHKAAVAAIREGLDDVDAGRVRPAGEVLRDVRTELDPE